MPPDSDGGSPESISEADLQALARLIIESMEGDLAGMARRRHFAAGVARLIEAPIWVTGVGRLPEDGSEPVGIAIAHEGWSSEAVSLYLSKTADSADPVPEFPAIHEVMRARKHATITSQFMLGRGRWWDQPEHREFRQRLGFGDWITHFHFLPEGGDLYSLFAFYRGLDGDPFASRERGLVHLACDEFPEIHETAVPDESAFRVTSLSSRRRLVFMKILLGWTASSIAEHLGISKYTVDEHIGAIYRHFGVRSRSALVRIFLERPPDDAHPTRPPDPAGDEPPAPPAASN
jgi:DNA-binding CsgD family transcriptional regulator